MRFALLGSGSEGNALVVQAGRTTVLLDCGFSLGETLQRLARLGLAAEDVQAVVVSHEHGDHLSGVARLARKYRLPVYLTHGTLRAGRMALAELDTLIEIDAHGPFAIGDLEVQPVVVPHDAGEPVQYVFGDGQRRLGVLTDTGYVTPHIRAMLDGCAALVLECNHDTDMLARGDYPLRLKQRVAGSYGHLSNAAAAELLASLDQRPLQHVVAAHISRKNNTPQLAAQALSQALDCSAEWIAVATQEEGLAWRELR